MPGEEKEFTDGFWRTHRVAVSKAQVLALKHGQERGQLHSQYGWSQGWTAGTPGVGARLLLLGAGCWVLDAALVLPFL